MSGEQGSVSSQEVGTTKGQQFQKNDSQTVHLVNEKRRAALNEIDEAAFSWFHVKIILVAGVGFFTDAYDIFAINIASVILGIVYHGGSLSTNQDLGIKVATPVGTFIGQLLFGWLADVVGRKRMYGVELMIIIFATFAQAIAGHAPGVSFIGAMIVWRVIAGVGIGGDYPLSAVISSEFSSTKYRGRIMTAVFSAQGFGNFAAALVAFITTVAYKDSILRQSTQLHALDQVWRILIGLGCVPGVIALYFRLTISETPRYTMDIERNLVQASKDIEGMNSAGLTRFDHDEVAAPKIEAPKASLADFRAHFGQWKNFKILFGAAWSWFALDIAFYGLGLNSSIVLQAAGYGSVKGNTPIARYQTIKNAGVGNIILAVGGLIPGYWFTFAFIDHWGRKPIQLMGFIMLTILFCTMGFGYDQLNKNVNTRKGFLTLYCFANFFQNFGPNTTTFVIPGEVFPTRYRSTAHGISAASGKLGAIIAQVGFARLRDRGGKPGSNHFVKHILEIFALFMLTGIGSTLLVPETKGRTLEELSNESQEEFAGGIAEKPVTTIV